MRSLILFRHGKSDWDAPFTADHERPLADRGHEAARCMGKMLAQTKQMPDMAVSSSAVRARETLKLAARAGHWNCAIRIDAALYNTSPNAMLMWLTALKENPERLLLTGHEPTWSDLAGRLVGRAVMKVPTAAMLRIDFEIEDWRKLSFGSGELRWLLPPKMFCKGKGSK